MHHFIYPDKDTYISSRPTCEEKNFGIDELLQIGTANTLVRSISPTREFSYTNTSFNEYSVQYFTGTLTGSLKGNVINTSGSISGSGLVFTSSYFIGSLNGAADAEYSGGLSGSVVGSISGSFSSSVFIGTFTGELTGSTGCLDGVVNGTDVRNEPNWITTSTKYIDRSLLKFDVSAVSASISNGSIPSPKFKLKLKVCNEFELPITYNIYALPVSQSWNMGDGYFSDGGSTIGASWKYKNFKNGETWDLTYTSSARPPIDFINNISSATSSFKYGGGTWYTSSVYASQSFNYEASDISMDVTEIVMQWISGSIPNEGFLLCSSDELQSTGSGFTLKFYSKDTNTIYSPYLDVMWLGNGNGGTPELEYVTASLSSGSITITNINSGFDTTVRNDVSSSFSINGGVNGVFSGSTFLIVGSSFDADNVSISGIVHGMGLSGNILGLPVIGNYSGIMSNLLYNITGSCGNSFSASLVTASLNSGIFSGSNFTAYYVDNQFENAILTGSWNYSAYNGTSVNIPIPSGIDPFAYAYFTGPYINGKALGTYELFGSVAGLGGTNSASFNGQFITGPFIGGYASVQLTGSVYTSSYSYTSSVEFITDSLNELDTTQAFNVVIQNSNKSYKVGDIPKIKVFGRSRFPLKSFDRTTQQLEYLVPDYLPSSSFYALKDHETGEIVLDFDIYTQLSCEYPYGNYFVIDTTGLPQERYYNILIRVNDGNSIYTIDTGKIFKITR